MAPAPGDRARRDDDRYLLLESAAVGARTPAHQLGGAQRARQQPAAAVDADWPVARRAGRQLAAGRRPPRPAARRLLAALSCEHPLQPFSPAISAAKTRLFTYASRWRAAHDRADAAPTALPPTPAVTTVGVTELARLLRQKADHIFSAGCG